LSALCTSRETQQETTATAHSSQSTTPTDLTTTHSYQHQRQCRQRKIQERTWRNRKNPAN